MKKIILMLACPAVLLSSCGDAAPSALKQNTEKVLSTYIQQDKAKDLQALAAKAEAGDARDIEALLTDLSPALMRASRASGGAKEVEMMQLMVDWVAFGAQQNSDACQVLLYLMKVQQSKTSADAALSAAIVPGDLEELKSAASEALKKLENKSTEDVTTFEKEALMTAKMLGL